MPSSVLPKKLPKILVVDDEHDNLEALKRLLRRDFEIVPALSGEQGLECLNQQGPFEVIVSDQRMPGMQGSEFLEQAQLIDPQATRILLTGFSDLEAVVDAINRGAIWHYISKPWEPADLIRTLGQAAERSRTRRDLDTSLQKLSHALTGLRAKDWARERLLLLLLHEFRTAPQIVESLRALNDDSSAAPTRETFLNNLSSRFEILDKDIRELLSDEKTISALEMKTCDLATLLQNLSTSQKYALAIAEPAPNFECLSHEETLQEIIELFAKMLASNQRGLKPALALTRAQAQDHLFEIKISIKSDAAALMPATWKGSRIDPSAAWNSMLEPFVGYEDVLLHSSGLRTQLARAVRRLSSLGGRAEFDVSEDARVVNLNINL